MITAEELAERTGIPVDKLKNWRTRRRCAGDEIGPKFVKAGGFVRYVIAHVEEWENYILAQNEGRIAPPDARFRWSTAPETPQLPIGTVCACGRMLTPYQLAKRLGVGIGQLTKWRRLRYEGHEAGPRFVDLSARQFESIPMYRVADVQLWESAECQKQMVWARSGGMAGSV